MENFESKVVIYLVRNNLFVVGGEGLWVCSGLELIGMLLFECGYGEGRILNVIFMLYMVILEGIIEFLIFLYFIDSNLIV